MDTSYNLNKAISTLTAYYGQVPDGWVDAAQIGMDEIDPADLEAAVRQAIKTLKWLPKISELRALAKTAAGARRDPTSNARYSYWEAMATYNDVLSGREPESTLDNSRAWAHQIRSGVINVGE